MTNAINSLINRLKFQICMSVHIMLKFAFKRNISIGNKSQGNEPSWQFYNNFSNRLFLEFQYVDEKKVLWNSREV